MQFDINGYYLIWDDITAASRNLLPHEIIKVLVRYLTLKALF